jgi:hypothetical protein
MDEADDEPGTRGQVDAAQGLIVARVDGRRHAPASRFGVGHRAEPPGMPGLLSERSFRAPTRAKAAILWRDDTTADRAHRLPAPGLPPS